MIYGRLAHESTIRSLSFASQMILPIPNRSYGSKLPTTDLKCQTREGGCRYDIEEVLFEGETAEVSLRLNEERLTAWMLHKEWNTLSAKEGEQIGVLINTEDGILFPTSKDKIG